MVKVLSARQLAGHLHGWLPQGFCYREYDVAHLRTPVDLGVLRSDGDDSGDDQVIFALRWRAIDPLDYEIPFVADFHGLVRMPPRDRIGPPVLGTGFAPSGHQAARYQVEALGWRGVTCTLIREDGGWQRLRLARPDGDAVAKLGAGCVERGIYEVWAPRAETTQTRGLDTWYAL